MSSQPVLARLGLSGPYQVHVSPVALVPDERAHQVFEGFGHTLSQLAADLKRRYPFSARAIVLRGKGRVNTTLQEIVHGKWENDDVLVLPAVRSDHPGGLYGLVWVVDRLLGPGGCPWDQQQTHQTLKRHLIEECYELLDAIDEAEPARMREELGDVLLQPVMHAQMEALGGGWGVDEVAAGITAKLIRRHPHVFGDVSAETPEEVLANWDAIKKAEKGDQGSSVLDGVPRSMPALLRAFEVSKRAARSGFEWQSLDGVWEKIREEEAELLEAVKQGEGVAEETGDLLFTLVNLARWLGVEPEDALRQMVDRFTARFQAMERAALKPLRELSFEEWDELWIAAKRA